MLERVRRSLSFANVTSVIALFVALGGSAYAVTQLDRNSVKSKHIVDGQVKSGDLAPAEAWNEVAPFQNGSTEIGRFRATSGPCYEDEFYDCFWHNEPYAPDHNTAAFYRDPYGRVHLKGLVCRLEHGAACSDPPANGPDTIFQLPAGYRPARMVEVATVSGDKFGRVQISADGTVSAAPPFDYESFSLEGISFRCAPSGEDGCP
jgi:hypothetical protein